MLSTASNRSSASDASGGPPDGALDRATALRSRIDTALTDLVADRTPPELYDPVRYILSGDGKRVRPVLLLLVAQALDADVDAALPATLSVEVFHNFTLVHDDIMDDAPERRGRPTVHTRWDTNTAILTGDVLMGLSYELLGQLDAEAAPAAYEAVHPMVEQVCAGQALDASFESREDVSVEAYLDMIDGKTAALLATVFELGGIVAHASPSVCETLREAGRNAGRAFQIQDDLLDLTADSEAWGKVVGGDLVAGKKTFLTLRALERAEGETHDWFRRIVTEGGLPASDVPEARDRMADLGVFDEARTAVETYTATAREHLSVLPDTEATDTLYALLDRLQARAH
jgi:geranylgeranyl diphosphate synthase type II